MPFFLEIEGLNKIEHQHRWELAVETLFNLWHEDVGNVNKLCRLIAECWIILSTSERESVLSAESFKSIKGKLIDCTNYGLSTFEKESSLLWLCGYMMSLLPYLFYDNSKGDLYLSVERKGGELLCRAKTLEPENCLYKVTYLGIGKMTDEYVETRQKLQKVLSDFFPGNTMIEEYFREVFSN